jgi:cytokinin dehydrogenase
VRDTTDADHAALFDYTLCALGQTAIIVGAELRTRPRPAGTLLSRRLLPAGTPLSQVCSGLFDAVAADAEHCFVSSVLAKASWQVVLGRDLATPPSPVPGQIFLERYHDQRFTLSEQYVPALSRALTAAGLLADPEAACNLWSDFLVPSAAADALHAAVMALCDEPRFTQGPLGTVLLRSEAQRARPLPLCPIPDAERVVSLGVYCVLPPNHTAEYERRFCAAAETCVALGGRVYLYGCHPRSHAFYERMLGPGTLHTWRAVKRRHDPGDVIGNGLLG